MSTTITVTRWFFRSQALVQEVTGRMSDVQQLTQVGRELVDLSETGQLEALEDRLTRISNAWEDLSSMAEQRLMTLPKYKAKLAEFEKSVDQMNNWLEDMERETSAVHIVELESAQDKLGVRKDLGSKSSRLIISFLFVNLDELYLIYKRRGFLQKFGTFTKQRRDYQMFIFSFNWIYKSLVILVLCVSGFSPKTRCCSPNGSRLLFVRFFYVVSPTLSLGMQKKLKFFMSLNPNLTTLFYRVVVVILCP